MKLRGTEAYIRLIIFLIWIAYVHVIFIYVHAILYLIA